MGKYTRILMLLLLTFVNGLAWGEAKIKEMTPQQKEVVSLIKKMYAISPDVFEAGTYGTKYDKYGQVISDGKYEPLKQCQLLEQFFVKEVIEQRDGKLHACNTETDFTYVRYPDKDLLGEGGQEDLPKVIINTPSVKGDKAEIIVSFEPNSDDSTYYYLKKLPQGWRIYKAEVRVHDYMTEKGYEISIFPPKPKLK